jgi:outer membrane biogenesis lipoprotein LolB
MGYNIIDNIPYREDESAKTFEKRMNRLILALIISCGLTACSNNGTKKSASTDVEQTQPQEQKDRVEVLYFHSK